MALLAQMAKFYCAIRPPCCEKNHLLLKPSHVWIQTSLQTSGGFSSLLVPLHNEVVQLHHKKGVKISQVQCIEFAIQHLEPPQGCLKYCKCDISKSIYGISNHPAPQVPFCCLIKPIFQKKLLRSFINEVVVLNKHMVKMRSLIQNTQ